MRETKHTPGPWSVDRNGLGELFPFEDKTGIPLLSSNSEDPLPLRQRRANGALIQAAPEMLAALIRTETVLEGLVNPAMRRPNDLLSEVSAVLDKALAQLDDSVSFPGDEDEEEDDSEDTPMSDLYPGKVMHDLKEGE